jgi:hypothetical protein
MGQQSVRRIYRACEQAFRAGFGSSQALALTMAQAIHPPAWIHRGFSIRQNKFIKRIGFGLSFAAYTLIAGAASNALSIADNSLAQPTVTTNLPFTLTLSGDTSYGVAVQYATADDSAIAGTDYTAVSGSVLIPAGSTSGTINVPVLGKTGAQPTRDFKLNLSNPVGIGLTPSFGPLNSFNAGAGELPESIAVADFNGDGLPDLVTADPFDGTVSILLNSTAPGAASASYTLAVTYNVGTQSDAAAVAVGDFNGDGLPDLAVANVIEGNGTVSILLNTTAPGSTTPSFTLAASPQLGGMPSSIAVGDFNGDGKPDLAVTLVDANKVVVLLNSTATGSTNSASFTQAVSLDVGSTPESVAVGDFNGDGKLDLAVANAAEQSGFAGGTVSILLNSTAPGATSASFALVVSLSAGYQPTSVAVGDFNGDGKPDVAVADSGSGSVSILLNGTPAGESHVSFTLTAVPSVGDQPEAVAIGDFNGDGKPDLVLTNPGDGGSTVSILLNTTVPGATSASFTLAASPGVGYEPFAVAVGDFNGDGKPDLATANSGDGNVSVLINTTPAPTTAVSFAAAATSTVGSSPSSEVIGDFNGDGLPDFAFVNQGDNTVSVMFNSTVPGAATSSFTSAGVFDAGSNPTTVLAADFNGDGKLDLAMVDNESNTVVILFNTTTPGAAIASFTPSAVGVTGLTVVTDEGTDTSYIQNGAVGDFNGDGLPDIALDAGNLIVLFNHVVPGSTTANFTQSNVSSGTYLNYLSAHDVNGDGRPDLVATSGSRIAVLLNTTVLGSDTAGFTIGTFATSTGKNSLADGNSIAFADFNGDGKPDIAFAGENVAVLLNATAPGSSTANFVLAANPTADNFPQGITVGDFDGDGLPDLAVTNAFSNDVSILLNRTTPSPSTSSASFVLSGNLPVGNYPFVIAAGDLNGDGLPDLITVNINGGVNNGTISILLNTRYQPTVSRTQATGTINAAAAPSVSLNPTALSFTNQVVSTPSSSQAVTLTNSGSAALNISGISFTGTNAADFSETDNCPTSLPATAGSNSCTINISFTPGASGSRSASLSIASNAGSTPNTVGLTGTGIARAPAFSLGSSSSFGNQPVSTTSAAQSVAITNTGNVPLTSIGATVSGANPTDFALSSNSCTGSLAVGNSCTLGFTFTPGASGVRSATETISATDSISGGASVTNSFSVSGTGTQPGISLSPSPVGFGSQRASTSSASTDVVLTNSGNGTLTLTRLSISAPFSETNDCMTTLAPGSSCDVYVSFAPTTTGSFTGSLGILSNAPGSPTSVSLSGTGVAPALSVSTPSDFGSVTVGSTSSAQSIAVSNGGTASLTISSIAIGGTNAGDFSQSNNCPVSPATLAGGSNCTVQVSFTPSAQGSRSGSLVVTTADAGTSTQTLGGSGTNSVPSSFSFTPITSGVDPGSVQTSNPITVMGINTTTPISISGGEYSVNGGPFTSAPGSVDPGDQVTVQQTASSNPATTTTATVTIGGTSAGFSVTTNADTSVALSPVTVKGGSGAFGGPMLGMLGLLALLRNRRKRRSGLILILALLPMLAIVIVAGMDIGTAHADGSSTSLSASNPPSNAFADHLYAGVRAGSMRLKLDSSNIENELAASGYNNVQAKVDPNAASGTVYIGYELRPHIDIELGYTYRDATALTLSGSVPSASSVSPLVKEASALVHGYGDIYAVSFREHGEILPRLTLNPRVGFYLWDSRFKATTTGYSDSTTHSGVGITLGVGLAYRIWRGLELGGGVDYFRGNPDNNATLYGGSMEWRFGGR